MDMEDFHDIFNYDPDFVERMLEIIQIPFWQDVLKGLKLLFRSSVCNDLSLICTTPLWYDNVLRLPIKPAWLKRGITTISDVLNEKGQIYSLEDFQNRYQLSSNFLEYGGFAMTIKFFLDNREKPSINVAKPSNCLLNVILCRDTKGVSQLYKSLIGKQSDILQNICLKWYTKGDINLNPYEVRSSFLSTHRMIDDIYLKYTQFRTLHYRFFTNDVLVNFRIKDNETCSICDIDKDSNFFICL